MVIGLLLLQFSLTYSLSLLSSTCTNYHPSRSPQQVDLGRGFVYHAKEVVCDLSYDGSTTLLPSDVSFPGTQAVVSALGGTAWRVTLEISSAVRGATLRVLTDEIFSDYDFYVGESEISSVRLQYTTAESGSLRDQRELARVTKFPINKFRVEFSQRVADSLGGNAVVSAGNFRLNDVTGNFLSSPSTVAVVDRKFVEFPIDLTAAIGSDTEKEFQLEFVASDELAGEIKNFYYDTVIPQIASISAPAISQDSLTVTAVWSEKIPSPEFSLGITLTPPDATCGNFLILSDTEFSFICTPGSSVSQNLKLEISPSALARDLPGNFADSTVVFVREALVVMGPPKEFAPVQISFVRNFEYPKEYGSVTGSSGNVFGDLEISWQVAVTALSYAVKVEAGNSLASDFVTIEEPNVIGNSLTIPLSQNSQVKLGGLYKVTVTAVDFFQQTHAEETSVAHSPVVFAVDEGELLLPDLATDATLWTDYPAIGLDRVSIVANSGETQIYADLDSNSDKLEVLGVRTWTGSDVNDPCVFQDERNRCSNFRVELYHAFDETNNVLIAPLRLRFEFNAEISDSFIPQIRQWEPLLSNWTFAEEFCSPEDTFNNYNGHLVYEISVCKLGGLALFFWIPYEFPTPGVFPDEIPPRPFTVGQPTMTCVLFTGISLVVTLFFRFLIWAGQIRRATQNREVALAQMDAPTAFAHGMFAEISDQQRMEADLSLEAQINVTRSRRAQASSYSP